MSKNSFFSILRAPDNAFGATGASPFRFEEAASAANDVKFDYAVENDSAKIIIYPSGSPVKYLKLRFHGDLSFVDKVYGDEWERSGENAFLEWRSVMASRALPWFCYLKGDDVTACYGVKTSPDCFAFWQVDTRGITLFLNLMSGKRGTDLKEPLLACEVVELIGNEGEDSYDVAKRFSRVMCDSPKIPKEPIFGVNNWYWAYGKISHESVMEETDQLMRMCDGTRHRPYMILDDGWQLNRSYGKNTYIGGPWLPNERFGDMAKTADAIHAKGAKAGIWFRPLLTRGDFPADAEYAFGSGGNLLDSSHPFTLEKVERDAATIRSWGFDLIKHDFTTIDITGKNPFASTNATKELCVREGTFVDNTKTTATVIKNLYKAIQRGAGDADVIGCNTISHLTAGIHTAYRVGNDTSGRSFEWTRRNGVNSVMRLPLNDVFYNVDPDCAAFTARVDAELNLDFLEMCAITGMTTLASVTPGILNEQEMKRINSIYLLADKDETRYGISNYDKTANPNIFVSNDGKQSRDFDWERAYDGTRVVFDWFN